MKIRRETDYAIRAIRSLHQAKGYPLFSQEIAKRESIPSTYILVIMSKLKSAGYVETLYRKADSKGGYILSVDLRKITLYDVYQLFEGDMAICECLRDEKHCSQKKSCRIHNEICRLNKVLIKEMKRNSIEEILLSELD